MSVYIGNKEIIGLSKGDTNTIALSYKDNVFSFETDEGLDDSILYPAPNSKFAYEDATLVIKKTGVELSSDAICYIKSVTDDSIIDTITRASTETLGIGDTNERVVDDQLIYIDELTGYLCIKHHNKMKKGTKYYVTFENIDVDGLDLSDKHWTFRLRSSSNPRSSTIIVNNNPSVSVDTSDSKPDFKSLNGALKWLNTHTGNYTVNVVNSGMYYHELLYTNTAANVLITSNASDPIPTICFSNCGTLNVQETERSLFEYAGSGLLVLSNLIFNNTYSRAKYWTYQDVYSTDSSGNEVVTQKVSYSAGEVFGMSGKGNLIAVNTYFEGLQDTLRLKNKAWIYNCTVKGDVDFVWGEIGLDVALLENCKITCVCDSNRSSPQSDISAPRQSKDIFVGKGIVYLNCDISIEKGTKTYFGRNPWDEDFYNNAAFVKCNFTSYDSSFSSSSFFTNTYLRKSLWSSAGFGNNTNIMGYKDYGNTLNGKAIDTRYLTATTYRNMYSISSTSNEYYECAYSFKLKGEYFTTGNYNNGSEIVGLSVFHPMTCTLTNGTVRSSTSYASYVLDKVVSATYKIYDIPQKLTGNFYPNVSKSYYTSAGDATNTNGYKTYYTSGTYKDNKYVFSGNKLSHVWQTNGDLGSISYNNCSGNLLYTGTVYVDNGVTFDSTTRKGKVAASMSFKYAPLASDNDNYNLYPNAYLNPDVSYRKLVIADDPGNVTIFYSPYYIKTTQSSNYKKFYCTVTFTFESGYTHTYSGYINSDGFTTTSDFTRWKSSSTSIDSTGTRVNVSTKNVDYSSSLENSTVYNGDGTTTYNGKQMYYQQYIEYGDSDDYRCDDTIEMTDSDYTAEYYGRNVILNSTFNTLTNKYQESLNKWDAYKDYATQIGADEDESENHIFSTDSSVIAWDFSKMAESTSEGTSATVKTTFNNTDYDFVLNVDATSSKFTIRENGLAQVNAGTVIKVPVSNMTYLCVSNYTGYQGYTIGGNTVDDNTSVLNVSDLTQVDGYVEIVALKDVYLSSIYVIK